MEKGMIAESERLLIEEFTPDMAGDVQLNSLDEDTERYLPDEVFRTLEKARSTVEHLISRYGTADGPFVYAVLTKDGGKNVGYVQLAEFEDGRWEIGYHIGKRFTGEGYATEAVKAFLPAMAIKLGIEEVYGICLKENKASCRVLEKCGFERYFTGICDYQGELRVCEKYVYKIG